MSFALYSLEKTSLPLNGDTSSTGTVGPASAANILAELSKGVLSKRSTLGAISSRIDTGTP